jgi:glycopeptide antibiotics resistance protein
MIFQLRLALDAPLALPALGVWALFALAIFWPVARRRRWSPLWTLLALLSLAPIIAFTVVPHTFDLAFGGGERLRSYVHSFTDPWAVNAELDAAGSDSERLANLLLFVPAGFFATLASRAPVRVALAAIGVPFLIEAWQAVIDAGRVASAGDWLHNAGGALAGLVAAAVLLPFTRNYRKATSPPSARRIPGPAGPVPAGWSGPLPSGSVPPGWAGPEPPRWPANGPRYAEPTRPLETTLRLDGPDEITVDLRSGSATSWR